MSDFHARRRHRETAWTGTIALIALISVGGTWFAMAKGDKPPAPAAQPAPSAAQGTPSPASAPAATPTFSGNLKAAGAGTCGPQIDALAAGTMGNVAKFNTVSKWATTAVDKRLVGVFIGQKYAGGGTVPYGATSVVAAPNSLGSCDAVAVQVLPSPLPCAKLRETMATRGRQIGDLADIPVMQDDGGETLLIPTAANTCVLVGIRSSYAK